MVHRWSIRIDLRAVLSELAHGGEGQGLCRTWQHYASKWRWPSTHNDDTGGMEESEADCDAIDPPPWDMVICRVLGHSAVRMLQLKAHLQGSHCIRLHIGVAYRTYI